MAVAPGANLAPLQTQQKHQHDSNVPMSLDSVSERQSSEWPRQRAAYTQKKTSTNAPYWEFLSK